MKVKSVLYASLSLYLLMASAALGILWLEFPGAYAEAYARLLRRRLVHFHDSPTVLPEPRMPFRPELRLSFDNFGVKSPREVAR